jgi:hypothetical protein
MSQESHSGSSIIAPGPSWNIPRISLPSCLGPLLQYEQEWWYYAGQAFDTDGTQYSLQFSMNRIGVPNVPELQLIACLTGIGRSSDDSYIFDTSYGWGVSSDPELPLGLTVPPVTDDSYSVRTQSSLGGAQTQVALTGGAATGTKGSEYHLTSSSSATVLPSVPYEVDLNLVDERGMVLEWQSGFIGPNSAADFGNASFEFAQPRLRITSGTLTLDGRTKTIKDGMLWLDRQVLTPQSGAPGQSVSTDGDIKEAIVQSDLVKTLYRGSWMGITLNNGLTMVCACFWQPPLPGKLQWQTGTLLGLPPITTYGNLYFNEEGPRVRNGGTFLRGLEMKDPIESVFDFDVNILQPNDPDESPHWQSPSATYANGWWIRIGDEGQRHGLPANLYLKAVVSGCENVLPWLEMPLTAYWEGAANVYADPELTQLIGHAFVEQMGYN